MCKNCQGRFFCARIAQGVWNFLPGAAVLAEHSTEPRGRVAAADAAASAGTSKSEERTETVPSGVRRVPVGLHEGPPVRRFFKKNLPWCAPRYKTKKNNDGAPGDIVQPHKGAELVDGHVHGVVEQAPGVDLGGVGSGPRKCGATENRARFSPNHA